MYSAKTDKVNLGQGYMVYKIIIIFYQLRYARKNVCNFCALLHELLVTQKSDQSSATFSKAITFATRGMANFMSKNHRLIDGTLTLETTVLSIVNYIEPLVENGPF